MRMFRRDGWGLRRPTAAGSALLAFLVASPAPAASLQERAVVSSEVAVSSAEAALRLEFVDGGLFEAVFRDGQVLLDGERAGSFQAGDALDRSWRGLLGQVVSLENGPLARALADWAPPEGLPAGTVDLAARLDRALQDAVEAPGAPEPPARPSAPAEGAVEGLLSRPELLPSLGRALEGIDREGARIQVGGGPVEIGPGETLEGSLVVVDADVEVRGTLDGDLVLVRGSLNLLEGGEIQGDVRLVDARLFREGGEIGGEVVNVGPGSVPGVDVEELRDRIRDEVRRELRSEGFGERAVPGPMRNLTRGIGGLIETLMTVFVLSGLGWVVAHFAGDRVRTVSGTIAENPARAGAVGLAGAFLLLPAWILGMLVLVVSVVGILALPFWILLYPLVAAVALFLGWIAVASLLGEWLSRRNVQGLERLRPSNLFHTVPAGIALLFLAFMAADILRIAGPLTGIFRGFLGAAGVLGMVAAVAMGLGGVLLTRAGSRPAGAAGEWGTGESWEGRSGGGWDPFGDPERASRWQARWDAERARWRRSPSPDLEEEGATEEAGSTTRPSSAPGEESGDAPA